MRPHATLAFGHADALAWAHAQLSVEALQQGAEQACAINAQGAALPMALAAVVVPKLRRPFACIDALSCRTPRPALPRGYVSKAVPVWRYLDYALAQSASAGGLCAKTSLLVGMVGYHLAASAVIGVIYGIAAGRVRLEAWAIRNAMQWDTLPPARNLGAQISRSIIDTCLGVPREDWLGDYLRLMPPWAAVLRQAAGEALTQEPVDWLCLLHVHGDGYARRWERRQIERALGYALQQLIAHAAALPQLEAPTGWARSFHSIDWPGLHRAITKGDEAEAARLAAQIDLRPLQRWADAPPFLRQLARAFGEGDAQQVRRLMAQTPLAGAAHLVTQARLGQLQEPMRHIRWDEGAAFCQTMHLAQAAGYLYFYSQTQRGKDILNHFEQARAQHQAQLAF